MQVIYLGRATTCICLFVLLSICFAEQIDHYLKINTIGYIFIYPIFYINNITKLKSDYSIA
jgi:hypothetical protein